MITSIILLDDLYNTFLECYKDTKGDKGDKFALGVLNGLWLANICIKGVLKNESKGNENKRSNKFN